LLFSQGTEPPTCLTTEYLGKQTGIVVASNALSYPDDLTLRELSTHSWIVNAEDCGTRRSLEDAFSRKNLELRIAIEADGKDFQLSMASRGMGLAVIPPQVYQTSPYRDRLQVLRISDFSPAQDVWIAHLKYIGYQEKAVECLRDAVLQYLQRMEEAALLSDDRPRFASFGDEVSDDVCSSEILADVCGASV
jgi:DNA-binding transcriptional LysR family regulator